MGYILLDVVNLPAVTTWNSYLWIMGCEESFSLFRIASQKNHLNIFFLAYLEGVILRLEPENSWTLPNWNPENHLNHAPPFLWVLNVSFPGSCSPKVEHRSIVLLPRILSSEWLIFFLWIEDHHCGEGKKMLDEEPPGNFTHKIRNRYPLVN